MKLLRQVRALAEENNISLEENCDEIGGIGFCVKFKNIKNNNDLIVNEIVNFIEKTNDGYTNSIYNIYNKIANNENEKIDLFVIQQQVERVCENKGIILDSSKYNGQIVGMPYDLEFMRKSKLNSNNIKFEDDETKIEYQKYLDEVNEYNRKIVNRETLDKDLSTIIDEFKQKFVIEEKNNFETNNYMLNGLKEKLDQNINSNLSYNE